MKKALIFLTITSIFLLSGIRNVYAETNTFYEAETIDNIYLVRFDGTMKYYQKARFFRRQTDNQSAYCLEPFAVFNDSESYSSSQMMPLNPSKRDRIKEIVRFGYMAENHTEPKWYAITQMMIWKELYGENNFYFTDTLNGNKIEPYTNEINEINDLINQNKKDPSFNNKTFHIVEGNEISLTDSNQVLNQYIIKTANNAEARISGNTLNIKKEDTDVDKEKEIKLIKTDHYHNKQLLFYYANNSQALVVTGNLSGTKEAKVKIVFDELKLKIKKTSEDIEHNHESKLQESEFTLLNEKGEKITDISLNEQNEATITSKDVKLNYGIYYLQEKKAGTGYLLNNKKYQINFKENNTTINLTIENNIIKKEITIKKFLKDKEIETEEENAIFEIYDSKNHLVSTLATNENGIIKTTLPYGHYKIKQIKGKEGYSMAKDFEIFIEENKTDYTYQLYDQKEEIIEVYEIEVPNTYIEKTKIPFLILGASLLYVQKKIS